MTIVKSLDPDAGAADLYAQEMTRVLLNLISNGFYATTKRKQGGGDGSYEPTIVTSPRPGIWATASKSPFATMGPE